jgi:hypothetical protein
MLSHEAEVGVKCMWNRRRYRAIAKAINLQPQ